MLVFPQLFFISKFLYLKIKIAINANGKKNVLRLIIPQ